MSKLSQNTRQIIGKEKAKMPDETSIESDTTEKEYFESTTATTL